MFSSSSLFVGFSNCCSAAQVAKDGDLELNKVTHFVFDDYDKMLSKICGCSQSNRRLQTLMSLYPTFLFLCESWFETRSDSFGTFLIDMQSDV